METRLGVQRRLVDGVRWVVRMRVRGIGSERVMNPGTKSVVASSAGMMAGGFTHFQLADSGLGALLKTGIVGLVAGAVALVMLMVLPRRARE